MKLLNSSVVLAITLVFFSGIASAGSQLTMICKENHQSERIDRDVEHKVTFDADKGYKNLEFNVYGSTLTIAASFYMKEDGITCGHSVDRICVSLKGSTFCTEQAEATLYPTGKYAQSGDRTFISCSIPNNKEFKCPTEEDEITEELASENEKTN